MTRAREILERSTGRRHAECRNCGHLIHEEIGAWWHRFGGQPEPGTRGCNAAYHDRLERDGEPYGDRYPASWKAKPSDADKRRWASE